MRSVADLRLFMIFIGSSEKRVPFECQGKSPQTFQLQVFAQLPFQIQHFVIEVAQTGLNITGKGQRESAEIRRMRIVQEGNGRMTVEIVDESLHARGETGFRPSQFVECSRN
jgi:hypothetical protein